jgi:hypothetical protein
MRSIALASPIACGPAFLASNTFDVVQCPETLFKDAQNGCPTTITCQ